MTETVEKMKPLKTWSYLSKNRRRPSEYEIVSAGLHFSTDNPDCPWELDPDIFMNRWFRQYREGSPLNHDDWDGFRDPDELVYRTYNIIQDGQENYIDGLIKEFDDLEHDQGLQPQWVDVLAKLYTPGRYLMHGLQMASAYMTKIAPASTISNCSTFQAADSLRWLSHLAYRTRQLSLVWPDYGFGENERDIWENASHWQGFRELLEKALIAYDWGETFVAVNLVLKPAVDEAFLRQFGHAARRFDDTLLGFLVDAQLVDSERSRRWTTGLVQYMQETESNQDILDDWVEKWVPLGDAAIDAFCAAMPDSPSAADDAKRDSWSFRAGLGLSA
ncbi:toluene monooxygenase [Emcibacter nanhaiensis]|uniref:Toluene monooxygenase n=2 Tax=Emcibacter nanhaiensis TaxID=1505037 RepID=A0A501PKM5_9PROT|nr:toluene monooxygenase [Emcibacter nanhaiensis]